MLINYIKWYAVTQYHLLWSTMYMLTFGENFFISLSSDTIPTMDPMDLVNTVIFYGCGFVHVSVSGFNVDDKYRTQ